MAQSLKPQHRLVQGDPRQTPLVRKSDSTRELKRRIIFGSPRPTAVVLASPPASMQRGLKLPIGRKMSLPNIKSAVPAENGVPRFRPRAASDPRTTVRIPRDTVARPEVQPVEVAPVIGKCYSLSQVGSVCCRPKQNNQDSYFYVHSSVPGCDYSILGVCDGHGQAGHFVSAFVAKHLPVKVRESCHHNAAKGSDFWSGVLIDSFARCNNELKVQTFDSVYSGCTSVAVAISRGHLYCANVGDSRAVLARRTGTSLTALPLSRDQKPDVPEEKQRIIDFGGRVEAVKDEDGLPVGPPRVWLMNEDLPGLAMSRAMGDTVATQVGVTATPGTSYSELFSTFLTPDDAFIVIASDGVWEFMSSQEVVSQVEAICKSGRPEDCCRRLVEEATERWQHEEDCVDDITAVVAFLEVH